MAIAAAMAAPAVAAPPSLSPPAGSIVMTTATAIVTAMAFGAAARRRGRVP